MRRLSSLSDTENERRFYSLAGRRALETYTPTGRVRQQKSRGQGMTDALAWGTLRSVERAHTTRSLSNGPERQLTGHLCRSVSQA
jgi:hypothetical protein